MLAYCYIHCAPLERVKDVYRPAGAMVRVGQDARPTGMYAANEA